MKKILFLISLLFGLTSCAGEQLILSPEINWQSSYSGYGGQPYGTYYPYGTITLSNNTPYTGYIYMDGKLKTQYYGTEKKPVVLSPGRTIPVYVSVPYNVRIETALVISFYDNCNNLVGSANQQFSFWGNVNQKDVRQWKIDEWNISKVGSQPLCKK